jgi:chromate reductase
MTNENKIKVLGISGSLRAGSYNSALLRAAKELAPDTMEIEIVDIKDIPLFSQDFESSVPESIVELKKKVEAADAILFVTPEYNYSIPGVLKNTIDAVSRPYGQNSWNDKPVAIMSASVGMLGGARAQYHLRQTFVFLDMHPLNRPEVMVPFVNDKFDANLTLTDEKTKNAVIEQLKALDIWTRRITA